MTYDDGIVGIYELTEDKQPGKMPVEGLLLVERFFYGFETLGINRYYTAKQAGEDIEAVIHVPGWHEIKANRHIAIIANANGVINSDSPQYRVVMVQPTTDEDGLRVTRLTLEKVGDQYAVFS